jgi:uncharacterized protein (DUF2267 family)
MRVDDNELVNHVSAHAGIGHDPTWRVTHTVMSAIGAYLSPATRELLADELGPAFGAAVRRGEASKGIPVEQHVLEPWMTLAGATELIACVCRVLAERLSDEVLAALRDELPAPLSARLVPSDPERSRREISHGQSTLAEGRPGSKRPLVQ